MATNTLTAPRAAGAADPRVRATGTAAGPSPASLMRWGGLVLVPAGVLLASFLFLHPDHDPDGFASWRWIPVHLLPHVGVLLALFGFTAAYARQMSRAGYFGLVAYAAAIVGLALMLMFAFVELFVFPILGLQAPEVLASMEQMTGPAIAGMTINMLFTLGLVLFGVATLRADVLPRPAAILLIGAPIVNTVVNFSGIESDAISGAAFALIGTAFAWLGIGLYRATPAVDPDAGA